MSDNANQVYSDQLDWLLGSEAHFTEPAIFDPSGSNLTIYGIVNYFSQPANKDGGNVLQKNITTFFEISKTTFDSLPIFSANDNIVLQITNFSQTFIINRVNIDKKGNYILWLK